MTEWYLRKSDGQIYGPVELADLQGWAADGRVEPGDDISEDRARWIPPEQLPDLELEYVLLLEQGQTYGPLHLATLQTLWVEEEVDPAMRVQHVRSQTSKTLAEWVLPLLLKKYQQAETQQRALQVELDRLQAAPTTPPTPPEETAAAIDAGQQQAEWEARLTAEQEASRAAETRCAQLEEQLQTLTEKEDSWAQEREALQAQLDAAEAAREALQARLDEQPATTALTEKKGSWAQEREALQAQLDAAEAAREALQARLDEQSGADLEAAGDEALRQAHQQLLENYDLVAAQLEKKTHELDALKGDAPGGQGHLTSQLGDLQQRLKETNEVLEKEREERELLERKHLQLSKSYRELNARYIQLRQGQSRPARKPQPTAKKEEEDTSPSADAPDHKPKLRLT